MKNYYISIVILLLTLSVTISAQFDDLMEKGNNLYKNEQYEDAISLYKRILDNGYDSGALYYNIGNSYFRLGELGYAILNYEKAIKIDPGNEDAHYNLRLVNARIVDRIKELPDVPIMAYWDIVVTSFSLNGWLTIFLVFWILLLASIAVYYLVGRAKVQRFALMYGLFNITMIIIVGIFLLSSLHLESTTDYGILLKSTVTAKSSPDANQADAFVIHEGIKFQIEEELSDWTRIKLADGKVGWLPNDSFEAI